MSYLPTITSSCFLRYPRINAPKSAIVLYKGRQSNQLADLDCAICENCWNAWYRQTGQPVPGDWVKTSCIRTPGTVCDLSDPRLSSAWQQVLSSRSINPFVTVYSHRKSTLSSCTPTGSQFMYALLPQYRTPTSQLPATVPQGYQPQTALHLCPSCYDSLDCTNLVNCFAKISTSAYGSPPRCASDLGLPVALAVMVSAHINDIGILAGTYYAVSYYSTQRKASNGTCVDTGRWFNVTPQIQNFDACEGCANTLLYVVPSLRNLVRQHQTGGQRLCDLDRKSHRFAQTFYSILQSIASNNAGEFTSLMSNFAKTIPCSGPLTPYQGTMYRSEKLVVDCCADCYFTQIASSDVANYFSIGRNIRFAQQPQLGPELNTLCCDVASERVKQQLMNMLTALEYSSDYNAVNKFGQYMTTRRDNLCTLLVQKWQAQKARHSRIQQQINTAHQGLRMTAAGGLHALGAGWNGVAYGNDQMGWFANDSLAQGQALFDASKRMGLQGGDYAEAARLDAETLKWV